MHSVLAVCVIQTCLFDVEVVRVGVLSESIDSIFVLKHSHSVSTGWSVLWWFVKSVEKFCASWCNWVLFLFFPVPNCALAFLCDFS